MLKSDRLQRSLLKMIISLREIMLMETNYVVLFEYQFSD